VFFIGLVGLDFALYLGFEPDSLVPLVLHISVIVFVELLNIDGFVFVFDAHESFVFFLQFRNDKLADHLLLQPFLEWLFSLVHLNPILELLLF
jgi:hypothetical protein